MAIQIRTILKLPFSIDFDSTELSEATRSSFAKFRLRTQAYFKQPLNMKKNSFFFFNINVVDQDGLSGSVIGESVRSKSSTKSKICVCTAN